MPTRSEIERWKPAALLDVAARLRVGDAAYTSQLDRMRSGIQNAGSHWHGESYDAAYNRIGTDCDIGARTSREIFELTDVLDQGANNFVSHLTVVNTKTAEAEADHCTVADDWSVSGDSTSKAEQHSSAIGAALRELMVVADDNAKKIRDAAAEIRACGNQLPEGLDPSGAEHVVGTQEARDQVSAETGNDMFGRYPLSPSDWHTATALNPNSYTEKYQGVQPEIKVGHIDPVPGQGVVRTSSFIEQYSVFNRPYYDLGDNRPNSPDFDPENSRVTTYVDYENGIVVMRQNPSVDTNGEVKVGSPDAEVWQTDDGSVRLKYEAANPFHPKVGPFEAPGDAMPTVHGDVVITPGQVQSGSSTGVTVNGTRADYPSFEVYHWHDAHGGQPWGPALNLWTDHDIGSGERALEQFQHIQEWAGRIPPTGSDLPSTSLGSTDNPPRVK
ncbi:WXG100 family type VII secretion target [Rhodococcus sp. NPDC127530]|uniref:WXG100 family type VII secretion target n=1 Tax=unclassified Rhodococcus (in: high G+C Gram-positive bacteria) TaxID=192944 RepID=UPI0036446374